MVFNSDTYAKNQCRRERVRLMAEARKIKAQGDPLRRLPTVVKMARGAHRRYLSWKRILA